MLMAAGLGTRLRPYSARVAKPLIPILGVPCAQFAIDALTAAGVTKIVANVHHLAQETRAGLEGLELHDAKLVVSDESGLLLGSAGGIGKALPHLGTGPFFIANADVLCSLDWEALARTHQRLRAKWGVGVTLALMEMPDTGGPGEEYRRILVDPLGERIAALGSKGRKGLMYVGCAVIEPELLSGLPEGRALELVPEILEPAIVKGIAGAHVFGPSREMIWLDAGSPQLWWAAHMNLIERLETGALPTAWRRRIEAASHRLAQRVWVSNRAGQLLDFSRWESPCYWGNGPGETGFPARPPEVLGSGSVLYGEAGAAVLAPGIGAFGEWTPVTSIA